MKYFKDLSDKVFIYEEDGSQDHLIQQDMEEITKSEADDICNSNLFEYEDTLEDKINKAKIYLYNTDFYYIRRIEIGEDIPIEVVSKRIEAREFIRANQGVQA